MAVTLPTEEASANELETQQQLGILLGRFLWRSGAEAARVVGRDDDEALRTWAIHERERDISTGDPSPTWDRLAREVMRHGRTYLDSDDREESGAVLVLPIIVRDHTVGALYARFRQGLGVRAPAVLWTAEGYARAMALVLDEPEGFGRLVGTARRDQLTGCLNSVALWEAMEEEIHRATRLHGVLSCAFLDLDGFKAVNDTDGHLTGDSVLAAVGRALCDGVRRYDTVARFGGDEFVIVMPGASVTEAAPMVDRLKRSVCQAAAPLTSVPLTATAGLVQWREGDGPADLLERADRQLLDGKATRRNRADQR